MSTAGFLTPWFPAGTLPAREGVYIIKRGADAECWHAARWHSATRSWYAAETTGAKQEDVIGWNRPNVQAFVWRGLARKHL